MTEQTSPYMERVHIRGFRSLVDVEFKPGPGANVLVGANGSGKSNLMRFFEMLSWMLKSRKLAEFVARKGGADDQLYGGSATTAQMRAEIAIRTEAGWNDYQFTLTRGHPDRFLFTDESFRFSHSDLPRKAGWQHLGSGQGEARLVKAAQSSEEAHELGIDQTTAKAITRLLRNNAVFQFHDTSDTSNFNKNWDAGDHQFMRSNGGNLPAILHWLEQEDLHRYERIRHYIQRVLPGFDGFRIEEQYGKVALRWQSKYANKTYGAHLTSDGSLRFFALVTLLNMPEETLPNVLLLDEPELGLHPAAITLVGGMIRSLAEGKQIIVATQSPLLVDAFELDEVSVLDIREGRTELSRPPVEELQSWLDDYSVGELWQKNLLGGRP